MSEVDPGLFEEGERMRSSQQEERMLDIGHLHLRRGGFLPSVQLCYQTWGSLNEDRSNAILICHAISGDSNAASWWSRIVGPGLSIDTNRYFVVCSNVIGGCRGSTGPSSLAEDGEPYGSRFPFITIEDMVAAQRRLQEHLEVPSWLCVAGGSMGGMQAVEWARQFPTEVRSVWATASAARHGAMQIGFNEVARQSIMRDPKWCGGDYSLADPPMQGLSVGRMLGHLTYLSEAAFESKFGRELQSPNQSLEQAGMLGKPQFQVESYLNHQGDKFTTRFDPNTLIVVSNAIDCYDCDSLQGASAEFLFTSFTSDWIYPSHQSEELHNMALAAECKSTWLNLELSFGHDAFLLDQQGQGRAVQQLLARQLEGNREPKTDPRYT